MRTEDSAVGYDRARGHLGIGVDDRTATQDDTPETEEAIALDAEAADEGGVNLDVVVDVEQVILRQPRPAVDLHIAANLRSEQAIVDLLQRRVEREDTLASRPVVASDNSDDNGGC